MTGRPQAAEELLKLMLLPSSGFIKPDLIPTKMLLFQTGGNNLDECLNALMDHIVPLTVCTETILYSPDEEDYKDILFLLPDLLKVWRENNFDLSKTFPENNFDYSKNITSSKNTGNKVIMLGDSGYGKTMASFMLFLEMMKIFTGNICQGMLPLIISAKTLGIELHKNKGIIESLTIFLGTLIDMASLNKDLKLQINDLVQFAFDTNNLLLIVDGLEDIDQEHLETLNSSITAWQGPIFLNSRDVYTQLAILPTAPRWKLLAMADCDDFLLKREKYENLAIFKEFIQSRPLLNKILRIPLRAAIACRLANEWAKRGNMDLNNPAILRFFEYLGYKE